MRLKGILAGSASALAILAAGVPAVAQSNTEPQNNAPIETVVVTGIRASLDRAIDIKRDSTAIVDAVSAEDIGKFPDKNVADALQRVPGVNTVSAASGEGGFDENDRVSIRGTNPSLTQTLVDGHAIANGDWFILDQFQTIGRSVSYTLLPSEIVDTAKVYKSQEADLVEGGVAGVVDIQTRKPLDFKDNLTIEASAEAAYTTQRGKTTPQLNALFAWKNDAGTVGVMAQAFYETRDIRRDGQEFLGYSQVAATNTAGLAEPGAIVGASYPTLIGSALFLQQRKREGGDIAIQFQPSDSFGVTLTGFYSHLNASNINDNYMFWGTNEFNNNVPTAYTVKNNTVVAATFQAKNSLGNTVNPIVADFIGRPGSAAETYYVNADGNWKPNENLSVSFKTGYSHGVGKTNPQVAWEGEVSPAAGGTASYNFGTPTGVASVSVPGVNLSDASTLVNDWAWTVVDNAVDREYYGQVDAEYHVGVGPIQSVKVGARYSDHKRTAITWDGGVSYGGSIGSQVSTSNYPSDFASAFKIPGMLTDVPQGNTAEIETLLFNNTSWRPYPQSPAAISNPKNGRFDWQLSMDMTEQDTAAYAMANIGGDNWKGNFGVRIVKTAETINQYVNDPTGTYSDFGSYGINKITHDYWDVLPSANISINLNDESDIRFAAAQTMARPDYSALGGSVQLTDLNLTGNGGNPNLKPVRSANYDLAYEWYYAPQSLFSIDVFYMDLSSYVSYGTSTARYVNMTLTGKNPTPVYSLYTITSPFNSSGHDEGVEISWQQPLWNGLGVIANYTYANGVDNGGGPLVGDSKNTANLTGYYENDWLSARLSYNYRSAMLVGLDRSSAEYQNSYGTLDASMQFTVTDNVSLTFDATNLTNQTLKYYAVDGVQPRAFYSNGTQLYAGVRFKY